MSFTLKNDCFSDPTCALACYWAGYIAADGSLRLRSSEKKLASRIALQAKTEDAILVEGLLNFIGSNKLPRNIDNNGFGAVRVDIYGCEQIIRNLETNFGVTQVKSNLHPWEKLSEEQGKCFLAGYIDGDGSVIWDGKKLKCIQVFTSSEKLMLWFKELMDSDHRKHTKLKNGFIFGIQGSVAQNFWYQIAGFAVPFLERKWRIGAFLK